LNKTYLYILRKGSLLDFFTRLPKIQFEIHITFKLSDLLNSIYRKKLISFFCQCENPGENILVKCIRF
jgi:hypothetical protein